MRLEELEPQFHRYETSDHEYLIHVESLAEAQGIIFLCPACFTKNGGPIGTHAIEATFAGRGATDNQGSHGKLGNPSRWTVSGNGYADLALHPSVDAGCWHGFITNGDVTP